MKKSYYLESGLYFDTTTQTTYEPKPYCEICGRRNMLTVHHKLTQHKCLKDLATKRTITPSTWTQEFIKKNQKLFTVCLQCHSDIHNCNKEVFFDRYKISRDEFIYK